MAELRAFIDVIRGRYGTPYPLADRRPYVSGRELLSRAQEAAGLDAEFCLVAEVRGQYVLTSPADSFVRRVTWDGDTAAEWRPHNDPKSPVRMNPDVRFGRPAITGIATEVLWEHEQAGESVEEIAAEFSMPPNLVLWALAYETSARARAA
jgi:uncharacterized protein (DUF433 family)